MTRRPGDTAGAVLTRSLTIRLAVDERRDILAAAARERASASDWVRRTLVRAARARRQDPFEGRPPSV